MDLENAEVVNAACPETSVFVLSEVAPSLNVTVPVAVPLVPVTAAVNVTDWPNTVGFVEEVSAVVLGDWLTICVSGELVLAVKLPSPL